LKHKDFIEEIARQTNMDYKTALKLSGQTCKIISGILSEGDTISIQSFGTFEVKKRNERISVNPTTGKRWLIPPKLVPGFKPGPSLKEKIKDLTLHE
jgi:DNA-binding protein HU-beta